jgi:hypothetical protein
MVHPSSVRSALVAFLALRGLLVLLLRTMVRHMSLFTIDVASSRRIGSTVLHWSSIGIFSARSLLSTLLILLALLVRRTLLRLTVLPILRPLLFWIAIPLANWSLELLMKAMLRISTLSSIAF